jgi:glutathione S-transferase
LSTLIFELNWSHSTFLVPPNELVTKPCSVKPDAQGSYTVPTIRFPDGSYLMDSRAIAAAIEERYPSPPIELKPPVEEKVRPDFIEAFTELQPVYVTTVYRRLINEASKPYFRETREAVFGKTLEQVEEENPAEAAFEKARPGLTRLTEHLKRNGGPFFEGEKVTFFDIVYAGMLLFFKDMGDDIWGLLLKSTGEGEVHEKFLEAMSPWTKKND